MKNDRNRQCQPASETGLGLAPASEIGRGLQSRHKRPWNNMGFSCRDMPPRIQPRSPSSWQTLRLTEGVPDGVLRGVLCPLFS
jgi:hypothetical protein